MVMFSITNSTLESSIILLRCFSLFSSSESNLKDQSSRSQVKQKIKKKPNMLQSSLPEIHQNQMISHIIITAQ